MFSEDKIYNIASISAFAFVLSVFYQIGYFSNLGIEFVSFINSSDVVVSAAFTAPFIYSLYILSLIIDSRIHYNETEFQFIYRMMIPSRRLRSIIGNKDLLAMTLLIVILAIPRFYFELDYLAGLFWVIFHSLLLVYWLTVISDDLTLYENADINNIRAACFFAVYLSYIYGDFYSEHHAGMQCRIDYGENIKMVKFFRNVSNGIIIEYNGDIEYVQTGAFLALRCPISQDKPSREVGDI